MDSPDDTKYENNATHSSERYTRHLGGDFGCRIEPRNPFLKENYHWYYLKDIQKDGVADQMKLHAGDELVLLNRQFTSKWAYEQLIDRLGAVPVDGMTRFSLVLLRRPLVGAMEWVVSSAILGVDRETGKIIVEHLHYKTVKGPLYDDICVFRLKVKGTNLFLKIYGGEVVLEVAKAVDMNRYNIFVWSKCHVDPETGLLSYTACLYGDNVNLEKSDNGEKDDVFSDGMVTVRYGYVTVSGDSSVTVTDTPQWFGYREEGRGQSFEVTESLTWISCDVSKFGTSGKLCLKPDEFFFESYAVGCENVNTRV